MPVYLDNNASTPLDERVREAIMPYLGMISGNASSLHRYGRLQRDAIETARQQVADLVGCENHQVVFTSGGTESNNLVLKGVMHASYRNTLLVGATEHMSVIQPAQALEADGMTLRYLPVDHDGRLDIGKSADLFDEDVALVSVMLANNETGVLQNIDALKAFMPEGAWLHCDATQFVGKLPFDFASSGIHAVSMSAHKIYGPQGVGALIIDKRLPIDAVTQGGAQENALRGGTENTAAIVGFGMAAALAQQELQTRIERSTELRDACVGRLNEIEGVTVFSEAVERLPNTLQFGLEGFDGETLLMQLDRKGIAVSSGSACTSGKTEPSHVLKAMGIEESLALSAVRVSFGQDNTMQDVDAFIDAMQQITELKQSSVMMAAQV